MPIPETVNHPIGCRRSDIWDLTPSLIFLLLTFMATRRRSSATKTAKSAPKSIKESTISVKKVTTPPVNRVNKVTQPKVKKVTETVTETPKVETKNVKSLLHDYPRDGFSLILLPLLLLEAGTKEALKLAGVLA